MTMEDDPIEEYQSSLDDLTMNSKPLINALTMLADEYVQFAPRIVQVIESRIQKVAHSFIPISCKFNFFNLP